MKIILSLSIIFTFFSFSLFGQKITTDTAEAYRLSRLGVNVFTEDTKQAIDYFNQCIAVLGTGMKTWKDSTTWEKQHEFFGELLLKRGEFYQASLFHVKGLELAEKLYTNTRFYSVIGHYSYNLGVCYGKMEYTNLAIPLFEQALIIYKRRFGEDHINLPICYAALANAYEANLDYSASILYYDKALSLYRELKGEESKGVAIIYNNLSVLHQKLEEFEQARNFNRKSIEIYEFLLDKVRPKERYEIVNHLNTARLNLAGLLMEEEAYEAAYIELLLLLSFDLKSKEKEYILLNELDLELAKYHFAVGQTDSLLYYIEQSIARNKKLFGAKHQLISMSYNLLGKHYAKEQNYEKALEVVQLALITNHIDFNNEDVFTNPEIASNSDEFSLELLTHKASILEQLYDETKDLKYLEFAYETYTPIDELLIKLRKNITINNNVLQISKYAEEPYQNALALCYKLYDITKVAQYKEQVFYYSNKLKSEALANILNNLEAQEISGIPMNLLEEERALKMTITHFQTEATRSQDEEQFEYLKQCIDTLVTLQDDYDALIARFESDYPRYYELKHYSRTTDVSELQELMDSKSAVIDYAFVNNEFYISIVTANSFELVKQKTSADFVDKVKELHELVQKRSLIQKSKTNRFKELSASIYDVLIRSVESHIADYQKLIIFPEGALHYLPFDVLLKETTANQFKDMAFLIKDYEISYHYSAYLLAERLRTRTYRHNYDLLAVAPIFDNDTVENKLVASVERFTLDNNHYTFKPLKWSEKEVQEISSLYEPSSSTIYFRKDANENNFKTAIENAYYNNIHISTHGLANTIHPDYSWLAFALSSEQDDDLLHSGEIYNLRLRTNLVVLSSCESGLGKLTKGEGMISLNRGFLYAGASNVVYSLWRVNDKYTYYLMKKFYQQIDKNLSYAEALRNAKLEMLNSDNIMENMPSNWCSFSLLGK